METILLQLGWAALPGILTGVVLWVWNHQQKAREEKEDKQEMQRMRSENLRISLLLATAKLSYAVAMATKRGYPNGEIEEGIARYEEAITDFKKFELELVAEKSSER